VLSLKHAALAILLVAASPGPMGRVRKFPAADRDHHLRQTPVHIDRVTARWIVVLLTVAGLAWVEAALHDNHYYRLTYEACKNIPGDLYCVSWRTTALFRAAMIIAAGAALLIYNERRSPSRVPPN
jgi:ribulose-5-phosphate 4-epimerase/fuculose-1-phosphate aldolase